jgi:ATP-dependent helicase HrpB
VPEPLPIDPHVPRIVDAVRRHRAAVVIAPPGSGKTTRVAPALTADGPVVLLQPRRVAARALARRIAEEQGWHVGAEVGWQVSLEREFGPGTLLLVATEGILTARLRSDPLLQEFRTVILDEFHERSLHADLALALVREAARAREELRVVVMSATLDAEPVSAFLGSCPVIEVSARSHPVEVLHAPHLALETAVLQELEREGRHVLAFLPGAGEIARTRRRLAATLGGRRDVDLLELHGSLSGEDQARALAPSARRKVVLATNLAETSLTIEGVTSVVDSGLCKVLRRDPATGIDRLETERVSQDAADQRAGRAGRTGPGRAIRLWDARERLEPHREPEIRRVDLAAPLLDVLLWGGDAATFGWFEPPPPEGIAAALELLDRLGAVESGRPTALGRALRRLPLHPRLARLLLDAGASREAAAACAALSEGFRPEGPLPTSPSDLLALADRVSGAPLRVRRATEQIERLGHSALPGEPGRRARGLLEAVLAAYPDRVARRRERGSRRLFLASGHGAVLDAGSGVLEAEFLVAVDLVAGARGPGSEAVVRLASAIEPAWLEPTDVQVDHVFDERAGTVRAFERTLHGALVLAERPVPPDPGLAARMLAERLLATGLGAASEPIVRRLRFAGLEADVRQLVEQACAGRTRLPELDLGSWLPSATRRELERRAPESLVVPSGRRVALDYRADGTVGAAVKLQELFGLARTPRIGLRGEPVVLSLLAPNGRPVQTTSDLESFWTRTYPEVRRELRGRYPRHPWPEDPWSAVPTARARPRRRPG